MRFIRCCFEKLNFNNTVAYRNSHSKVVPVKMAFASYGNNYINNAPPLIIMHGLFGSKQNWHGISKALEKILKQKIYTVDARNHGESPHDSSHGTVHMAADLKEFMRLEGASKASFIGHSMGGRAVMYFLLKYPRLVERAVIVDISPISIPRDFSGMEQIFEAMKTISVPVEKSLAEGRVIAKNQIKSAVGHQETVDFIMLNLRKSITGGFTWACNIDVLHKNLRGFENFMDEIGGMSTFNGPVSFVCGKQSNFVNPEHWPDIQKIFPNSDIHWLDAGHLVHLDQPAQFINIVTEFLQK